MKKLFSLITILLATIMLSSCVYVGSETPVVIIPPTYSLTFNNQTSIDVDDWYVQKIAGKKFYVNPNMTNPVYIGETSTISGLFAGRYKICFSLYISGAPTSYYETEELWLNKNYEYTLYQRLITIRSANAEETESKEFFLVGPDGNEIPLIKTSEK